MAKSTAAVPADLLAAVSKKATKTAKTQKAELPKKKVPAEWVKDVRDLIRLGAVSDELRPLLDGYKTSVGQKLLDMWLSDMWAMKKQPPNFTVPLGKDKDPLKDDMSLTFQVKFRADGLNNLVPDFQDLPEGVSVEDKLHEILMSNVGLSEENADRLLHPATGDIAVTQEVSLADSFSSLYVSEDEAARSGATKLLQYIQATAVRSNQKAVELPLLSDEENAAILVTRQVVLLKRGFYDRACSYCRTEEELRKLVRLTNPTLQFGSFEFGLSDKASEKVDRLSQTVKEFLTAKGK